MQMKLVCRPSKLSLIQAGIVKEKIETAFPDTPVEIIPKPSRGDLNQDVPIYELGEKDVFTSDIDAWLLSGAADLAVHSMKDVSVEQYENNNFITAIVERDIPHDVVIFNPNIEQLIAEKKIIRIGTSSLRREELVPPFLKKALPNGASTEIKIIPIRGNVDTRLKKLRDGDYDGIVLAAAGLNRLLNDEQLVGWSDRSRPTDQPTNRLTDQPSNSLSIVQLLAGTKKMFLPLIECTPAPAQGAILAVALGENRKIATILEKINQISLKEKISAERLVMKNFGGGCHQRYGVHAVEYRDGFFLAVAGKNNAGENISGTHFDLKNNFEKNFENEFEKNFEKKIKNKIFFSATDFMKSFFEKKYFSEKILREKNFYEKVFLKKNIFVAHHHAVGENKKIIAALKNKNVWTAGTRTWFELAQRGIWVEGCADGFGLDWLQNIFCKNIVNVNPKETLVLTNDNVEQEEAAQTEDLQRISTYYLVPTNNAELVSQLQNAHVIFWTSFMQFQFYNQYARTDAQHCCPSGKTAEKLRALGLNPIVFPSIKVFLEWREVKN